MTLAQRAFWGAVVGAVVALLAHPASRPWVQFGIWRWGPSEFLLTSPLLPENLAVLPDPTDAVAAGRWVEQGASRLRAGTLDADTALLLIEVARAGAERERDNAYWRQAEAVFQAAYGNGEAAVVAWERASRRARWSAHQSESVERVLAGLEREDGARMAWHGAAAQEVRGHDLALAVLDFGGGRLAGSPSLEERLAAMRNGVLLRNGGRSREASREGHRLVEWAAGGLSTGEAGGQRRPREEVAGRFRFVTELAEAGLGDGAREAERALVENEAWEALVFAPSRGRQRLVWSVEAGLAGSLTGCLVAAGAVCLAGWGLVRLSGWRRWRWDGAGREGWWAGVAGVSALGVFAATRELFLSLWAALAVGGGLVRPAYAVESGDGPGRWFWVGQSVMGSGFALALGLSLTKWTAPGGMATGAWRGVWAGGVADFEGTGFWVGRIWGLVEELSPLSAAVVFLGGSLGLGWAWAFRQRRRGFGVAMGGLEGALGRGAAFCALAAGVLAPVCIYWDRQLVTPLTQTALNEAAYYLTSR